MILKEGSKQSLDVVFRSGLGSGRAASSCRDPRLRPHSGILNRPGISAWRRECKKPPEPVNIMSKVEATEGMKYIGAGFPLGKGIERDH